MKQSHFTTPRSMDSAQWSYDADPIEGPEQSTMHRHDKIVLIGCAVALAILAIVLGVWK